MWPLLPAALAAGLDADGLSLPVSDGSVSQPALLETAPLLARRQLVLGIDAALTVAPLVRQGGDPSELVPGAGMAYLRALGMGTSWLGGELHFPVRFAAGGGAGPAIGDLRTNLLLRPLDMEQVAVAVRLGVSAPTGSVSRYSGVGVVVPRAQLAGRFGRRFRADFSVGASYEGQVTLQPDMVRGGAVLDGGLGLSLELDRFGFGLSGRAAFPTASEVRKRRGVGAELGVHSGLSLNERIGVHVMGSRALTGAAGIPVWRLAAGATFQVGAPDQAVPEVGPPPKRYVVRSPDGLPVAGATVRFQDRTERSTDAEGALEYPPGRWSAEVRAKGLVPAELGGRDDEIVLAWAPTPIRIEVTTDTGEPVAASVEGLPLENENPQVFVGEVAPGTQELVIRAEGFGTQTRTIEVEARRTQPLVLEVVLIGERGAGSLEMRIEDPQGHGIEAAEVRLDGLSVGTSATGTVKVEGLAEKRVTVEVESPYFGDFAADVNLSEGPGYLLINPYYAPGTVRIVATGPDGPVRDGTVFLDGPRALAPLDLTPLGERLIRLAEGTWDILLSSPALGLQERRVGIRPQSPVPVNIFFELLPQADGAAELQVQVTDAEGRPLSEVELRMDGVSVGRTSTEGMLRLYALQEGESVLYAEGQSLRPASLPVVLHEGLQEARLTMDWEPGSVQVRATTPSGPLDANAMFAGPEPYEGGNLGPSGRRLFPDVPPGEWEVVATHELGMEVALTVIEEGDPRLVDVALQLGEEQGDATLNLELVDPLGHAVEGAQVSLDGIPIASTASGGSMRVAGLVAGQRQLQVQGPFHLAVEQVVTLPADVKIQLPFEPGLADVFVTAAGEPVPDAVVFFDGPEPRPAVTLGTDGYARVALGAGAWTAVVSSPTLGLMEHRFELASKPGSPQEVQIELQGTEELLVRVQDETGAPVVGATVMVNDAEAGVTGSSGVIHVERGEGVTVGIRDPRLVEVEPARVSVERTELLLEVAWKHRPVQIQVRADGAPMAAWVQAIGPAEVDPVYLGTSGLGSISLPPGRWELLASAEGYGVGRRRVTVKADGELPLVSFELTDAQVTIDADAIRLKTVLFESGAASVTGDYAAVIEEIAATVIADPQIVGVQVQGHTDDVGGPAYNFELSRRRARAVVDALVERGVPPDMVQARGLGQTRPIASNEDEEGRARNRRVHFEITREDDSRGGR